MKKSTIFILFVAVFCLCNIHASEPKRLKLDAPNLPAEEQSAELCPLVDLPRDMLHEIINSGDIASTAQLLQTNKYFNNYLQDQKSLNQIVRTIAKKWHVSQPFVALHFGPKPFYAWLYDASYPYRINLLRYTYGEMIEYLIAKGHESVPDHMKRTLITMIRNNEKVKATKQCVKINENAYLIAYEDARQVICVTAEGNLNQTFGTDGFYDLPDGFIFGNLIYSSEKITIFMHEERSFTAGSLFLTLSSDGKKLQEIIAKKKTDNQDSLEYYMASTKILFSSLYDTRLILSTSNHIVDIDQKIISKKFGGHEAILPIISVKQLSDNRYILLTELNHPSDAAQLTLIDFNKKGNNLIKSFRPRRSFVKYKGQRLEFSYDLSNDGRYFVEIATPEKILFASIEDIFNRIPDIDDEDGDEVEGHDSGYESDNDYDSQEDNDDDDNGEDDSEYDE